MKIEFVRTADRGGIFLNNERIRQVLDWRLDINPEGTIGLYLKLDSTGYDVQFDTLSEKPENLVIRTDAEKETAESKEQDTEYTNRKKATEDRLLSVKKFISEYWKPIAVSAGTTMLLKALSMLLPPIR